MITDMTPPNPNLGKGNIRYQKVGALGAPFLKSLKKYCKIQYRDEDSITFIPGAPWSTLEHFWPQRCRLVLEHFLNKIKYRQLCDGIEDLVIN